MDGEFYFNVATGEVEEGRRSDWSVLLGPYPTREAAAHAFERAHERTDSWEAADRAWRRWDGEPDEPDGPEPDGSSEPDE